MDFANIAMKMELINNRTAPAKSNDADLDRNCHW